MEDAAASSVEQQLVGVAVAVVSAGNSNGIGFSEKTKRGRPPRVAVSNAPQLKRHREGEEGEDVCFICFDGGSLVLCDRKGCPKAYHPACIKRDEAFFRSKAKWNCGWHVCSVCQKASHYMCYTCTYSLCKGCTKNADFLCVRRNKGFCSTCMRIIMLIENIDQGIQEMVQVDFDDKSSWEYLFKVYWMYLKEKLSLTQNELIQAKSPWKGSDAVHAKRQRVSHPVAFDGKEGSIMVLSKVSEKREAHGNIMKKLGNQGTECQVVDRSASETSITSLSTVNSTSTKNSDTDKLWHYRDPSGKIQGPFSVTQLKKWNTSGLFPLDMRIWTNDEHDDSVLLTNALKGLFHKAPQVHGEISHQSKKLGAASVNSSVGWCATATGIGRECGGREVPWHLRIRNNHSNGNTETARMDGLSSSSPQCLDLNNSYSDKPHASSPEPSSSHGNVHRAPLHGKKCPETVDFHYSAGHMVRDSSGSPISQISDGCSHSMQSHSQRHLGQSSGQNWGSSNSNRTSVKVKSGSSFASVTKSIDSFEQGITTYPDLPSPTPKTSYDDVEAQAAEELLSLSSIVPVCASNIQDLPSPKPELEDEAPVGQAAANKDSLTS
ncbi:Zinc finger CCCH domain-containing protein 19, partial [Capsicum chinense]